jgi:hypothetical protein
VDLVTKKYLFFTRITGAVKLQNGSIRQEKMLSKVEMQRAAGIFFQDRGFAFSLLSCWRSPYYVLLTMIVNDQVV